MNIEKAKQALILLEREKLEQKQRLQHAAQIKQRLENSINAKKTCL